MKLLMTNQELLELIQQEGGFYGEDVMQIIEMLSQCRDALDRNTQIRILLELGNNVRKFIENAATKFQWADKLQNNLREYAKEQYFYNWEKVPNVLHFVWIGSSIPKTVMDYIKVWAVVNPDYQINIWYDSTLLRLKGLSDKIKDAGLLVGDRRSKAYIDNVFQTRQRFFDFAKRHHSDVFVRPGTDVDMLINGFAEVHGLGPVIRRDVWNGEDIPSNISIRDLYEEGILAHSPIYPVYIKEAIQLQNFAALSDMVRLLVLKLFGGVYIDADMLPELKEWLYEEFEAEENCQRVLLQAVMQATGAIEGYATQYLEQSERQEEIRQAVAGKELCELMVPLGDLFCHRAICRVYHMTGIINQMIAAHHDSVMVDHLLEQIVLNYQLMDEVFGSDPILGQSFEQSLEYRVARKDAVINTVKRTFLEKCCLYHGIGIAAGCNSTIYLTGPGIYSGGILDMTDLTAHESSRVSGLTDYESYKCFLLPSELLSTQTEEEMKSSWSIRQKKGPGVDACSGGDGYE